MEVLGEIRDRIRFLADVVEGGQMAGKERIDSVEMQRILDLVLDRIKVDDFITLLNELICREMFKIKDITERISVGERSFSEELYQALDRKFNSLKQDFSKALDDTKEYACHLVVREFYGKGE